MAVLKTNCGKAYLPFHGSMPRKIGSFGAGVLVGSSQYGELQRTPS